MNIVEAFQSFYQKRAVGRIEMVQALRMIFADKGYDILFDYPKLRGVLWDLAPAEEMYRARFAAIYESGAIEHIRLATRDPYKQATYFDAAEKALINGGADKALAKDEIFIFREALGFPTDSVAQNPQRLEEEGETYFGEVKNGKRNGRGHEELSIEGDIFERRDALWINDAIYGYCFAVVGGVKEYSFCINGKVNGTQTHVTADGAVLTTEL